MVKTSPNKISNVFNIHKNLFTVRCSCKTSHDVSKSTSCQLKIILFNLLPRTFRENLLLKTSAKALRKICQRKHPPKPSASIEAFRENLPPKNMLNNEGPIPRGIASRKVSSGPVSEFSNYVSWTQSNRRYIDDCSFRRIFLNARCECVVEDKVFFPEVFADFFVVFLMQKLIKKNHRSIPGFEV